LAVGVGTGSMGSTASPFVFNDAIIGLAQSLIEALNQVASRREPAI